MYNFRIGSPVFTSHTQTPVFPLLHHALLYAILFYFVFPDYPGSSVQNGSQIKILHVKINRNKGKLFLEWAYTVKITNLCEFGYLFAFKRISLSKVWPVIDDRRGSSVNPANEKKSLNWDIIKELSYYIE